MITTKIIKSFLRGMGSVLDLSGTYFEVPQPSYGPDDISGSLYDDWMRIADDLKIATSKTQSKNRAFIQNKDEF